jgi:succinate dehydrogenase / fumarate reductase flavoprotein subunit
MQGLADGYFVIPHTVGGYIGGQSIAPIDSGHAAFKEAERVAQERIDTLLAVPGKRTVDDFHRELGLLLWDQCGMARNAAGLSDARQRVAAIRNEFWENVTVTGTPGEFNQVLERAGRVADFLEFGETMVHDALTREESCGGHFREEHQTQEGEALRDDENFTHVAAWEHKSVGEDPALNLEHLVFDNVALTQRSYK